MPKQKVQQRYWEKSIHHELVWILKIIFQPGLVKNVKNYFLKYWLIFFLSLFKIAKCPSHTHLQYPKFLNFSYIFLSLSKTELLSLYPTAYLVIIFLVYFYLPLLEFNFYEGRNDEVQEPIKIIPAQSRCSIVIRDLIGYILRSIYEEKPSFCLGQEDNHHLR